MNSKEMTNEQLISAHYDSARRAGIQTGLVRSMESRAIEYERREAIEAELLRRLNEADALRKENELLRKLLGECPKRNRLGSYTQTQPVQIDVCKLLCDAKESEASHDR